MYSFSIFFQKKFDRATEGLKISILGGFFGEIEVYMKNLIMQFCCALFHDINFVSMQNLQSVAFIVSEKPGLDMTDRRTDRRTDIGKLIFFVALIKNIGVFKTYREF